VLSWLYLLRWLWRAPATFVAVGADVVDGGYGDHIPRLLTRFCSAGHSLGAQASLANFSWRKAPHPGAVAAVTQLPAGVTLVARDPLSQHRAEVDLGRRVALDADVAFLMRRTPSAATSRVADWCDDQRAAVRTVVGLSLNALHISQGSAQFATVLAQIIAAAAPARCAFVPVIHDYRGTPNDRDLTELVMHHLAVQGHTIAPTSALSAPEVKEACGNLDLLITGRMHAAIAALGVGTPVVLFGYADKAEGLMSYFGLVDRVIPIRDVETDLDAVVSRLRAALTARDTDHRSIGRSLPAVLDLARQVLPDSISGAVLRAHHTVG
jgi:polysaccharide pyruvyl transferase WcaK-like protein